MPTYEFKCEGCQKKTALSVAITAEVITPHCFECKQQMKRVYAVSAVKFKGKGFYTTDKSDR